MLTSTLNSLTSLVILVELVLLVTVQETKLPSVVELLICIRFVNTN